jgi:hypothetical protein
MKIPKQKVISVLEDLLSYAESHTCLHEETYRGGNIWEICSNCGMKWADDEGGKPADAHEISKAMNNAYDLLYEIRDK